ncbi:hypothetical protein FB451DRAFT_1170610 [Mycena latifolia]|nr:hypothetical protein FB451DRAFT_1170610 [Mycena latifolia]
MHGPLGVVRPTALRSTVNQPTLRTSTRNKPPMSKIDARRARNGAHLEFASTLRPEDLQVVTGSVRDLEKDSMQKRNISIANRRELVLNTALYSACKSAWALSLTYMNAKMIVDANNNGTYYPWPRIFGAELGLHILTREMNLGLALELRSGRPPAERGTQCLPAITRGSSADGAAQHLGKLRRLAGKVLLAGEDWRTVAAVGSMAKSMENNVQDRSDINELG